MINEEKNELTFILVAVFFIGQQIVEGITVRDNISNTAHIVGGIVGGLLGYELTRKRILNEKETRHEKDHRTADRCMFNDGALRMRERDG